MCILDKNKKLAQKCAANLLHTWVGPGVFLFYYISCLDVERPPAPSPVCNKLVAQGSGDSCFQCFLLYSITQSNLRL